MSSLIDHFLTNTYTVTRRTPASYQGGFYVPGQDQTLTMRGSLQPLTPRDVKMPEEGARLKQDYKFYSDSPLLVINTKSLANSDVVTIDGETYKVTSQEKYIGFKVDLPYFKMILEREPEQ